LHLERENIQKGGYTTKDMERKEETLAGHSPSSTSSATPNSSHPNSGTNNAHLGRERDVGGGGSDGEGGGGAMKDWVDDGAHRLSSGYTFWFMKRSSARTQESYEKNIKNLGTFRSVRFFLNPF
jgi:hypothetical protein